MTDENRNPIGKELCAQLPVSPDSYPQKFDLIRSLVLVIRIDAGTYRSASFLDDRILVPSTQGVWLPIARVAEAAGRAVDPRPLHFIFHTGHVGSTLVSRLLDETGIVLPLREPLPLRSLAEAHDVLGEPESLLSESQFGAALEMTLRLWARGYEWTRAVVVKATSSAGRIAVPLLEARPESRAICLNLGAEPYLATLLSGQNSAEDLRGHGPGRIRRLQARCTAPLGPLHLMSLGELAALGWLVETASQRDAMRQFPDRVMAIDFDAFLAAVPESMGRVLAHFGLPRDERYLAGVGASPVLLRYSKAPDRAYSPEDRSLLLRESRRLNSLEIRKGMAWIERHAE
ncbi:MAG: hypothetical protein HW392_1573 [Steroidobacteraceae bacterium]|nr:hypothetical protein [Steroidobacteraceae bacterium]